MFGLFGKSSPTEKLEKKHKKLLEEAYRLSHQDRTASDKIAAEAEEVAKEIDRIKSQGT